MGKKGGAGVLTRLRHVETWLFSMIWVVMPVSLFFFGFYALTREFIYSYFFTPATYGVLTTNWYRIWDWWKTALFALMVPFPGLAAAEIIFFKLFWVKIVFLVYLCLTELW
jgi:hypothetical protein